MNRSIAINKLSEQLGLTSRTLRHWEAEGLFTSERDASSGWRMYDGHALSCIRVTALLRKMDIPLKDIKEVLAAAALPSLTAVVEKRMAELQAEKADLHLFQEQLEQALAFLRTQGTDSSLLADEILTKMEDLFMQSVRESRMFKIISLPPMRVAYHTAVGVSPEDEAIAPVLEWVKASNLISTARLLGGNVKPLPSRPGAPYGYGMCVTIPDGVPVPDHLKEMVLPGGLFAMLEAGDDVPSSWNTLTAALSKDSSYQTDRSRLCFEEHIRNDQPEGGGNAYHLTLLQPVKER
ncbi:MerR family transcriptional regulator [Gorillibacterium sp. CAU 1737]|uniref:MerR family transcriptional regulator n=1 Tax=Gorillibacterium sp. CAU 1737 TaxID=3140362 RepID=UPI0032618A96